MDQVSQKFKANADNFLKALLENEEYIDCEAQAVQLKTDEFISTQTEVQNSTEKAQIKTLHWNGPFHVMERGCITLKIHHQAGGSSKSTLHKRRAPSTF